MVSPRLLLAGFVAALSFATAGCTNGYGYTGIGVGAGTGYYNDPYFAGRYGPGYYGWYDNYYYPGTGAYVYDRHRRAYPWNDGQRRYCEQRRNGYAHRDARANWRDFRRDRRDNYRAPRPNRGFRPGHRR